MEEYYTEMYVSYWFFQYQEELNLKIWILHIFF